jgi:bifunctional non-homologous end joining protein LigD
MNHLIHPMLATLVGGPFDRPGWVNEEKYDGVRALAYRRGKGVKLFSRNQKESTAEFLEIAHALANLPGGDFVLDGEIVAFDSHDVSRFQLLQRRALGEGVKPVFAMFDCLELNGKPILKSALRSRREAVETLLSVNHGPLLLARRLSTNGFDAFKTAQAKGWEGIIAKDEFSCYEPGKRSRSWLKIKCRKESEFVIGGFTAPEGRRLHFGALLVGLYDGWQLRFTGKVGTGYSEEVLADMAKKMAPLVAQNSPFEPAPRQSGVTWLRPSLVAQIAFTEWTQDGKLRQPAFLGLRDDKKPSECLWREREK